MTEKGLITNPNDLTDWGIFHEVSRRLTRAGMLPDAEVEEKIIRLIHTLDMSKPRVELFQTVYDEITSNNNTRNAELPDYFQVIPNEGAWYIVTDSEVVVNPEGMYAIPVEGGFKSDDVIPFCNVNEPLFFVQVAAAELGRINYVEQVLALEDAWAAITTVPSGREAYRTTDAQLLSCAKDIFRTYCPWADELFTPILARGWRRSQEAVVTPISDSLGIPTDLLAQRVDLLGDSIKDAYIRMATNKDPDYRSMQMKHVGKWLQELTDIAHGEV